MAAVDVERLSSAAMFHDIGKARIPLAVLDKPARLDDQAERALIETHPAGYEVLNITPGISPEILDAVSTITNFSTARISRCFIR